MKFGRETTLQLATTRVVGHFSPNRIDDRERQLVTPTLDLVTGIRLPDGRTITNEVHSSRMGLLTPTGEEGADAITLSSAKARRLTEMFRRLEPGHLFECHDLVGAVEKWDEHKGMGPGHLNPLVDDGPIESGKPYAVFAYMEPDTPTSEWTRRHSALGTDSGRLLGLVGEGLMLVVADRQTTLGMYDSGYHAALTENVRLSIADRVLRPLVLAR